MQLACCAGPAIAATEQDAHPVRSYTADGRSTVEQLSSRFQTLSADHGWQMVTVYAYPGEHDLAIRAWRTAHRGEALWDDP